MLLKAALFLLCALWVILCMRFYFMISKKNVMQRRVIAIAAGLGAGLVYLLGSMILHVLFSISSTTTELNELEDAGETIRVQGKSDQRD